MRLVYGGLFPEVAEKYVADNPPTDADDKTPKLLWRVSNSTDSYAQMQMPFGRPPWAMADEIL
jgi:hypothetical protein